MVTQEPGNASVVANDVRAAATPSHKRVHASYQIPAELIMLFITAVQLHPEDSPWLDVERGPECAAVGDAGGNCVRACTLATSE